MGTSRDVRQRSVAIAGSSASVLAVLLVAGCSSSRPATPKAVSPPVSTSAGNGSQSAPPNGGSGAGTSQTAAPVESNPPGDIADNVAYVNYRSPGGGYSFAHPEGWTSIVNGSAVMFTDKLNGIAASVAKVAAAPTVAAAKTQIAALQATQPAFELRAIKSAALPGGDGVLIVFRRNSTPDAVTGKVFRDEVNRYEIYQAGRLVTLDLYGAVGSDNVDPYARISKSLRLS
jgi:hypothetical protein